MPISAIEVLADPDLRLEWAEKHIAAFEREIQAFVQPAADYRTYVLMRRIGSMQPGGRIGGSKGRMYRPQIRAVNPASMLGQVLGISGVGFLITAAAAYFFQGTPTSIGFIAMLVGFGLLFAIQATNRNPALSLGLFYLFTFAEGIGISPIITQYLRVDGPGVVVDAATCTGLGMLTLGIVAYGFSIDWRRFSGVAFGLLLGLIVVGLISAFTHFLHPGVYAWLTLGVFTLLTLIDFSRIRAAGAFDSPVLLAVQIYLDALNIFLAFLQIFGNRDRR